MMLLNVLVDGSAVLAAMVGSLTTAGSSSSGPSSRSTQDKGFLAVVVVVVDSAGVSVLEPNKRSRKLSSAVVLSLSRGLLVTGGAAVTRSILLANI